MFKILIPVDLTDSSYKACTYAFSLCDPAREARVVLLHCYQDYLEEPLLEDQDRVPQTPSEVVTDHVLHRNHTDALHKLDELYNTLKKANKNQHLQLERVFMYGLPEECIPQEVARFKPDLLVLATKAEPTIARSFFGTVPTNVAQDVAVPVLTVPATYEGSTLKRVLYATDFDSADTEVLLKLQQLVQPFEAVIECVHVSDEPSAKEHARLEELRNKLQQAATTNLSYTLLEGDNVAEALQKLVSEQAIDLLALTTHSRTLLGSLLNPSVSKKMMLESQVPLLIFHSSDKV